MMEKELYMMNMIMKFYLRENFIMGNIGNEKEKKLRK